MALQDWHLRYTVIDKHFGEYDSILEPTHPLGYLVSLSDHNVVDVANRVDEALRIVSKHEPDWLKSKIVLIRDTEDLVTASATLAEIRALSDILKVWGSERIDTPKKGSDFVIDYQDLKLSIEVNTPQGRSEMDKVCRSISSTCEGNIRFSVREYAPYGLSTTSTPTVQAEVVSKTAAIKSDKSHQFPEKNVTMLWLDYNDPAIWPIPFPIDNCQPLMSGPESLISGYIWLACYGQKGDPCLDGWNLSQGNGPFYRLEFDGRFKRDLLLDFVLVDCPAGKVLLQNHFRGDSIPDYLFLDLFSLLGVRFELSWVDWPLPGMLSERVHHTRKSIERLISMNCQ